MTRGDVLGEFAFTTDPEVLCDIDAMADEIVALRAIVQRVREEVKGVMALYEYLLEYTDSHGYPATSNFYSVAEVDAKLRDILAALTPTREGA
jgi:hypothetical protein